MIWIVLFALLAWIYLLILHGGFWLARPRLDAPPQHEPVAWPRIVAVVPARNEADVVAEALESLAKQDYPGAFTVLLIDDRSDDATAAEAQAVAARVPGRLEVLSAGERPPGWTGKLWALNCGTQAAAAAPNFWWFTDADIHHAPDTLRRLVEEAERGQGSQVSLMVRLSCRSAWEKLLIPAFVFFFQKLYPFPWVCADRRGTSAAAGGCMLIRADDLAAAGGLPAIKHAVIDDCSLAHLLRPAARARGRGLYLGLTLKSYSIRPYADLWEIWRMVARSAYTQLHHRVSLLVGTLAGMVWLYLAAPFAVLATPWHQNLALALLAGTTWALMALAWLPTLRLYGLSPLRGLLLPLAGSLYTAMTFDSACRHWLGKGAVWKGRIAAGKTPAA